MKNVRYSIGILSAAVIAYQLALMQILSAAHFHHFAYMVISVAMLGFGASGTILSLFRKYFLKHCGFLIPFMMIATAIAMGSALYIVENAIGGFDTYLLFTDKTGILKLFAVYLVYAFPFLSAALAIGLSFMRYADDISLIYFYNMAGSGIGGLAGVAAMWILFPEQLASAIALLPLIAAAVYTSAGTAGAAGTRKKLIPGAAAALAIIAAGFFIPPEINISEYKSLSTAMNLPGAEVLGRITSPHGVVTAVKTDAGRYAPGISMVFKGTVPVEPAVYVNSSWAGPVSNPRNFHESLFLFTPKQLPYIIRPAEKILAANAGTGRHVVHALANNAKSISAVESNIALREMSVKISEDLYGTDIFSYPEVNSVDMSLRSWLNSSAGGYSHIILPAVDAFGGTAGLYALQEQYDLTIEAFCMMWDLLLDDGVISVTSWVDQPPRNTLRILSTLAETASAMGVSDVRQHIAAVRSWAAITFVLSRKPITPEEAEKVRKFSSPLYFDPALLPDISDDERQQYNMIDASLFSYMDLILSDSRNDFYNNYIFRINPATDNKPFFSQFLKLQSIRKLEKYYGAGTVPFMELGYLVLLLTGVQIILAGIIFIILPLFYRSGACIARKGRLFTLFYFGGIGTGFMLVEINLIQQFIYYFGQPVYSAAAVIGILLISSGIGSYFSSRVMRYRFGPGFVILILVPVIFALKTILPVITGSTISLPAAARFAISVIIISPAGFMMGIPFPCGISQLSGNNSSLIPWAWGINSCFSVISTAAAVWIAIESGYSAVLTAGAAAYAAAGAAAGAAVIFDHAI